MCEMMMTRLPHPPQPKPLCSWRCSISEQIVYPSISVEAWIQGSEVNGLLYPSFKPSEFCCHNFCAFQLHGMMGMINIDAFCSLWGGEYVAKVHQTLHLGLLPSHRHTLSHTLHIWCNTQVPQHSRYSWGPLDSPRTCLNVACLLVWSMLECNIF